MGNVIPMEYQTDSLAVPPVLQTRWETPSYATMQVAVGLIQWTNFMSAFGVDQVVKSIKIN